MNQKKDTNKKLFQLGETGQGNKEVEKQNKILTINQNNDVFNDVDVNPNNLSS